MRLCVYKDSLSVGRGADKAVKAFAAALEERGHDVALVERGAFAAALEERWDAIVATGSNEAVDLDEAGYFERAGRSPVVLQLHLAPRGFFKWKHPLRNRVIRRAFRKADAVQLLCSEYVEEFGRIAPKVPAKVIGNYTEMQGTGYGEREAAGGERVILYPAAAVNKVKNQKLLIEAFAKIAVEFPGWRVRLLGKADSSYASSCRALARRLGVAERVEFAGFTDDLAGEYSRAEFIAFPSVLEGFPLAILEAAAFALPAVAQSSLPGAHDIVKDGETGFVADEGVSAYADALSRMMLDGELRRRLGVNARERCAAEYSRERILSEWEVFLQSLQNP